MDVNHKMAPSLPTPYFHLLQKLIDYKYIVDILVSWTQGFNLQRVKFVQLKRQERDLNAASVNIMGWMSDTMDTN